MIHCSIRSQIACSLNRALLGLGRDNALRRSYLRRRWQSCHPPSDTYRTASGNMPRRKKTAIELCDPHRRVVEISIRRTRERLPPSALASVDQVAGADLKPSSPVSASHSWPPGLVLREHREVCPLLPRSLPRPMTLLLDSCSWPFSPIRLTACQCATFSTSPQTR